jgi:hypothetical protein
VDLDAISLVSWMVVMDGGVGLFVSDWSPGNAVLSVPQFHDSILVARFVCGMYWGLWVGSIVWGWDVWS